MKRVLALGAVGTMACAGPRPSPAIPESRVEVFTRVEPNCYRIQPTLIIGDIDPDADESAGSCVADAQDYARLASGVRAGVSGCRGERAGIVGAITFRLVINPNGDIAKVEATSSLPAPLVACATRAVETLEAAPPGCGARTTLVVLFR